MSTYTKLRDGSWGVRSDVRVSAGDTVTVRKKDGASKQETVRAVLWSGPDSKTGHTVWLCSIAQREQRSGYGNYGSSGGYTCRVCGHDGDTCADLDCTC